MREFNKRLSSIRIRVEHAFGLLKGRFPSLKEFGRHDDMAEAYKAIEALMILHNICIDFGDKPEDIWDFDATDEWTDDGGSEMEDPDEVDEPDALPAPNVPARETETWLKNAGRAKRMALLNMLFPA